MDRLFNLNNIISSFTELLDSYAEIEVALDKLIASNFSEEESIYCKKILEEYLSSPKSNTVINILFDKLKEELIFKKNSKEPFSNFRKLIKFILVINNEELLSYLETNFLKKNNLEKFFIILEEAVLAQKDTSFIEDCFIGLIIVHGYNYFLIERFVKTLSKDKIWFINKLLVLDYYNVIINQIFDSITYDKHRLEDIVQALSSYKEYPDILQYSKLTVYILQYTNNFVDIMLTQSQISSMILESTIIVEQKWQAIENYSHYLYNKNPDLFYVFESQLMSSKHLNTSGLLNYVINVPFSSKRLVLKTLVSQHAEKTLISFIKEFPEYQNLLPML